MTMKTRQYQLYPIAGEKFSLILYIKQRLVGKCLLVKSKSNSESSTTKMVNKVDGNALGREHLEDCHYTISGYWDENEFYQEITFVGSISAELVSSSLGITVGPDNSHWLKFKFLLLADTSADSGKPVSDVEKRIGELVLIFDSNLEFVDENWLIDVKSPFVVAKCGQDLNQNYPQESYVR